VELTNALAAVDLSIRYRPNSWALRGLRLSIPQGGIVGLVGPNGAGKSTLLKSWVGFVKPTSGQALVLGMDPWADRRAVLTRVSYLAQTPTFYRDLSVEDHLSYVAHYRGRSFDRPGAVERLGRLGIPLRANAKGLSGGQAAQLGLAIAFALHSDVLLLDEPLASLDPLARRECIEFLAAEVSTSGATAVLSSHIISDIEQVCVRLILLAGGDVRVEGTVADLRRTHFASSEPREGARPVSRLIDGRTLYVHPNGTLSNGDQANLDDIVLGYLAAAQGKQ
jgi:ABC-2 type transport system ATP-binding protein